MRKRRAVSPIIAVLIIIVVTVAISVLFYLWLGGFMSTMMGGAGTFGSLRSTGVAECIDTTNGIFKIGLRAELGDVILDNRVTVLSENGQNAHLPYLGECSNPPNDVDLTGWYIYDLNGCVEPDPDYSNLPRVLNGGAFVVYVRLNQPVSGSYTFKIGVIEGGGPGDITITV